MKRVLTSFRSNSLHPAGADQWVWDSSQQVLATQGAVYVQGHCLQEQRVVYTSALLATTMKPLNALSKFENHFAIRTVSFQVHLEAGGYFSAQELR